MTSITADAIASVSLKDADTDPQGFADKLGRSFEEFGFAIIADHGIPQDLIERAEEVIDVDLHQTERGAILRLTLTDAGAAKAAKAASFTCCGRARPPPVRRCGPVRSSSVPRMPSE